LAPSKFFGDRDGTFFELRTFIEGKKEDKAMEPMNRFWRTGFLWGVGAILAVLMSCAPLQTARPTLDDVRLGKVRDSSVVEDTGLQPGEIRGEVAEVNRARREIYVIGDDGRRDTVPFEYDRTHVTYHGWDYNVDSLESGDRIAYQPLPRSSRYIDVIRIQEPVQARSGSRTARAPAARPRTDVVEGTVDRVDYNLGVFDVLPRAGRRVTVSVPYNARPADVDNFRALRRGDPVRVEGEFVSPDNFQLLSFVSPR
jgi:hypothetical protein